MCYQKKFFVLVFLFAGLFLLGCNKDKESESVTKLDLDKILNLPYSQLSPDEQKIKLENESLAFLELCHAAQTSPAVEAIQNLNDLLGEEMVEFGYGASKMSVKSVKAAVEYADFYGIFTWNASKREWDYMPSNNELKFVFPAKKKSTANNASLSIKLVSSGVLVEEIFYLPKSVTCTLTVDNKEAAKIEWSAEYKNNKPVPVKTEFRFTTGDGYSYWWKIEKGNESQVAMKLSYKNQIMFEVLFKSGIKLDEIFNLALNDELDGHYDLLDQANGYVKLMDDLVLVYTVDLANYIPVTEKIVEDFKKNMAKFHPMWADDWYAVQVAYEKNKNRYTDEEKYRKERSDKEAKAFNDYMKVALFSLKDNYKIADLIARSEKDEEFWDDYYWNDTQGKWLRSYNGVGTKKFDFYANNPYLKFNDNTEVEASVYFSEVFSNIEEEFKDFIKSFDR